MAKSADKKRLPNFCNAEKIRLVELVEKNQHIIENKKSDMVNMKEKEKCWVNISHEFNSCLISGYRDVPNLKNCWDNLKKRTRKYYAEIRKERFKTGGGTMKTIVEDPIAESVKRIIEPSVMGLTNRFDSDYVADIDDPKCSSHGHYEMLEEIQSSRRCSTLQDIFENDMETDDPLTYADIAVSIPSTSAGTYNKTLQRKKQVDINKRSERQEDIQAGISMKK